MRSARALGAMILASLLLASTPASTAGTSHGPYSEAFDFAGLISCGVAYGPVQTSDRCEDWDVNAKSRFQFPMNEGLTGFVIIYSAGEDALGQQHGLQFRFNNPPEQTTGRHAAEVGDRIEIVFDEEDRALVNKATPGDASLVARPLASSGPTLIYQHEFHLCVITLYHGIDPADATGC